LPAKPYLAPVAGIVTRLSSVVASAGAPNDGDLVALDATGRIDISVLPTGVGQSSKVIQASEALAANDLVNVHDVAGARVRKADATAVGKGAQGFVRAAVASGANATVFFDAQEITGLTGLVPGQRRYLSTTPGLSTAAAPSTIGNVLQLVGIATSATTLQFEPDTLIVL
jgi:hypothetical protein